MLDSDQQLEIDGADSVSDMTHAALSPLIGRSTNSSARRLAKIETEQGSASFPRSRGSMSIPGKKQRALRECRVTRPPRG